LHPIRSSGSPPPWADWALAVISLGSAVMAAGALVVLAAVKQFL
jgi:hypothetical protein